ncbi:jg11989 [Pararge aegeria aegeria]|uniref:Jg11989 protein n=1 Tax=Pararge aegeria aegeria TaxID=348720 RepID=A0A8S4R3T9_9NEOP|nr:jg11989 [Pararge aegeria aegeria]
MVLWGDSVSSEFRLACGVRQGGLTSPDLFNLYVNNLIEELSGTGIGCHIGGVCFNNLSYADDMVLLSPSINGIRKLLHICKEYARNHGLKYNVRKSEMVVFRAGKGPERIPPVLLDGTPVQVVEQFKYLGHMLSGSLSDDLDIERERRSLAIRCNMLARRFARCSEDVKITLFKAYCLSFYTSQLWISYTKRSFNTLRVQYNDALRVLLKKARYCSASGMFADAGVPDFYAVLRKRIASFWEVVVNSNNKLLRVVAQASQRIY